MRFYHNLNKLAIKPYSRGFQASSTALFNTEIGILELKSEEEVIDSLDIVCLPDFLEILVEFIPIPFDYPHLMATYYYYDKVFPSVPLYSPEKIQFVKAIDLIFAGVMKIKMPTSRDSFLVNGDGFDGLYLKNETYLQSKLIHRFCFDFQEQSVTGHFNENKEIIIFPYAGFYKPGCHLNDIQQVFCTIEENADMSYVHCSLLDEWHNQGRFPPQSYDNNDKKLIFRSSSREPYISFVNSIRHGKISISLSSTDEEAQLQQSYVSMDIFQHGPTKAFIQFIKST